MAEPVLRDPVPPEPARRPGPQTVRAGTPATGHAADPARTLPAEPASTPPGPTPVRSTPSGVGPVRTVPPVTPTAGSPVATPPLSTPVKSPRSTRVRAPRSESTSQEMLHELRTRLEDLRDRVEKQAEATRVSLKRELTQDADYLKIRARYYHERRPLQAVGIVAAGAFALGLFVGLWRR